MVRPAERQSPEARTARRRERGLAPAQAQDLRRTAELLRQRETALSGQLLLLLAAAAPGHPEVWRLRGHWHGLRGEHDAAAACLGRALQGRPDDDELLVEHMLAHDRIGDYASARVAADRLLQRQPAHAIGRLERSRLAMALGDARTAAADCRWLIGARQHLPEAWFTLVDLKVEPLSDAELAALAAAFEAAAAAGPEAPSTAAAPAAPGVVARAGSDAAVLLGFALGNALDRAGRLDDALDALARAHTLARRAEPWDAAAFDAEVAAVQDAFLGPVQQAAESQGHEVLFLVGMPRSGTTLVEQVLAAHPEVEGASELPHLPQLLAQESRRRGRPLSQWAREATAADWGRLGREYLALTAPWRRQRPRHTDKLPGNWLHVGAALAMLPGARIVDCRRSALETCWSCWKQRFGPGLAAWSHDWADLAAFWRAYDGLARFWLARDPARVASFALEDLLADPAGQIDALLRHAGLPFDPAVMQFQQAARAVRTPSALQVRQPLRASPGAAAYGDRLHALRQRLEKTRSA